jgi:DNA-binding SARP family transcriptional activator
MASQGPPPGVHVTYNRQYRRCAKPGCPSCGANRPGHGPYWYAYWREGGRQHTRYLGKHALAEAPAPAPATLVAAPASATAVAALRVRTLGGFALWRGEQRLDTARLGRGALRLLQYLLSASSQRRHREQVLEDFWPEATAAAGGAELRRTLHVLRRLLDDSRTTGSYLRWQRDLLALIPCPGGEAPAGWLDAEIFATTSRLALAGQDAAACREALAHYGGTYLPEEPYAEWAVVTREALAQRHLALLLHLAELCRAQGEPASAGRCLREALLADPCHEGAAQALMELLAAAGRGGEALRVYQGVTAALDRELGLGPQAPLERLRARCGAAPVEWRGQHWVGWCVQCTVGHGWHGHGSGPRSTERERSPFWCCCLA